MSRRFYPQAEPPEPITCIVYLFVVLAFVVAIGWIALKTAGVI